MVNRNRRNAKPTELPTRPVSVHRLSRSLALAMVRTDYPRKLTQSIAEFLQKIFTSQ